MIDAGRQGPPGWGRALAAAGAGSAGTILGSLVPWAWAWPLVPVALVYPLFVTGVRSARLGETVAHMLVWAIAVSVTMVLVVETRGPSVGARVIQGPAYAEEMLLWIRTGVGPEGSPAEFLPLHARHYATFVVASLATGGLAGLYFGTILLDYMNFYVATLAGAAVDPARAYAIGWPLWAIARVVGYIAAGTALAHVFYCRFFGRGAYDRRRARTWMLVSVGLVILDVVLKATLAEAWRGMLGRALGP